MSKSLDVYLINVHAGELSLDKDGNMQFMYDYVYVDRPGAMPLSLSLPLRKESYQNRECRGFFSGLLPEGEVREIVARNLGISPRNDYSMLREIGRECAGAVMFIPPGEKYLPAQNEYKKISTPQLIKIIKELPLRPLLAGEEGIRLSLAGAQEKIAVRVDDDKFSIPIGSSPSTHILKPAIARFEGIVSNEALCMKLAAEIGLHTSQVQIFRKEDVEFLLISRYDRVRDINAASNITRLHQEDFCQALGIVADRKYQSEGGPSLKDSFQLIREYSALPVIDLQRLFDAVMFNYFIGNHDAHAKNFSLLYNTDVRTGKHLARLAPLYDLICTAYYPTLSPHLAMEIGDKYKSDEIGPKHIELLAQRIGFPKSTTLKRMRAIGETILARIDHVTPALPIAKDIAGFIKKRVGQILKKFSPV